MQNCDARSQLKIVCSFFVLFIATLWTSQTYSEEWSAAQKEVWNIQEQHWQVWKEKGSESLYPYYHKESKIWGAVAKWPSEFNGFMRYDGLGGLIASFELKPFEIRVFGNVAVIMYEAKVVFGITSYQLRCTDIWMKQEGKWKIIGAMHDSCSEIPRCP